jgi:hypothetical protein
MIRVEMVPYGGWKNCVKITNDIIEIIATTDVGPRIISCGFKGKDNLFYENPEEMGKTGGETWKLYGGHRLWVAPELPKRTYFPDNFPVEIKIFDDGVQLTSKLEETTGIQKIIEVQLSQNEPQVFVNHKLTNHGIWPVNIAPWALSVVAANGVAVLPHPQKKDWSDVVLPTHSISIWGYTNMGDPRYTWGEQYVLLRQDPNHAQPQKIGVLNRSGWAAYVVKNTAFIKYFTYVDGEVYEDFGSNLEAFTNGDLLELETLGPLKTVGLNESVSYKETWYLAENVPSPKNDADVNKHLLPIVNEHLK